MKDPDAETQERIDDLHAELARKDEEIAAIRNWYPSLERDAAMKRIRELRAELRKRVRAFDDCEGIRKLSAERHDQIVALRSNLARAVEALEETVRVCSAIDCGREVCAHTISKLTANARTVLQALKGGK